MMMTVGLGPLCYFAARNVMFDGLFVPRCVLLRSWRHCVLVVMSLTVLCCTAQQSRYTDSPALEGPSEGVGAHKGS